MLAKKKDAELKIIEGLYNHDSGSEIHNLYPSWNGKSYKLGPCHTCTGPHFI